MTRKTFLSIVAVVACTIGGVAAFAPYFLLTVVKSVEANGAAATMARTVGVLLLAVGVLNFAVRGHGDGPTMRAVLKANLLLQVCILPIDPVAYMQGIFPNPGAFVPNTILHVILAGGFAFFLWGRRTAA